MAPRRGAALLLADSAASRRGRRPCRPYWQGDNTLLHSPFRWRKWEERVQRWKETARSSPQFLRPKEVSFGCPLKEKLHLCPFPCYLLLSCLQAGSGCSYSRVRFYLLLWACFCEDLPLRHDCNPVLFMPLQLLQAISFTFPRRV